MRAEESPPELRPREVVWREQAPEGKLDLLTTIDFRMTSNALFSDVVLPAATWYEKYDLSSTDLHPFVHAFNEAIPPPWEAKSDWDAFHRIAQRVLAPGRAPPRRRRDLVAAPLLHDTPDEIAQPLGEVRDWRAGECEPVPGRTMPKLMVVERDYPHVGEQLGGARATARAARQPDEGREPGSRRGGRRTAREERRCARRRGGRPAVTWSGSSRRARRSWRCRARATGAWRWRGFARWRRAPACRWPIWPSSRAGDRITFAGRAGAAADGDHLAGVVGDRGARPPLRAVHDQRRAREAMAHALGPPALLSRSRLDARARGGAAGVPPAAASPRDLRRPGRPGRLGTARS